MATAAATAAPPITMGQTATGPPNAAANVVATPNLINAWIEPNSRIVALNVLKALATLPSVGASVPILFDRLSKNLERSGVPSAVLSKVSNVLMNWFTKSRTGIRGLFHPDVARPHTLALLMDAGWNILGEQRIPKGIVGKIVWGINLPLNLLISAFSTVTTLLGNLVASTQTYLHGKVDERVADCIKLGGHFDPWAMASRGMLSNLLDLFGLPGAALKLHHLLNNDRERAIADISYLFQQGLGAVCELSEHYGINIKNLIPDSDKIGNGLEKGVRKVVDLAGNGLAKATEKITGWFGESAVTTIEQVHEFLDPAKFPIVLPQISHFPLTRQDSNVIEHHGQMLMPAFNRFLRVLQMASATNIFYFLGTSFNRMLLTYYRQQEEKALSKGEDYKAFEHLNGWLNRLREVPLTKFITRELQKNILLLLNGKSLVEVENEYKQRAMQEWNDLLAQGAPPIAWQASASKVVEFAKEGGIFQTRRAKQGLQNLIETLDRFGITNLPIVGFAVNALGKLAQWASGGTATTRLTRNREAAEAAAPAAAHAMAA